LRSAGRGSWWRDLPRKIRGQAVGHGHRFIYTPRHCSWLNQVEIWFSILARRLLKRASFTSLEDLRSRTTKFIGYFNDVLAKPFRWTYTGRPLRA
jgi:transposase